MEAGFLERMYDALLRNKSQDSKTFFRSVGESLFGREALHRLRDGELVCILGNEYPFPDVESKCKAKDAFDLRRSFESILPQGMRPVASSSNPCVEEVGTKDRNWSDTYDSLLWDIHSRMRMTYRRNFVPIGSERLRSDVGWGCTLRSGQMLLAQSLCFLRLGRNWRIPRQFQGRCREEKDDTRILEDTLPKDVLGLVDLFLDVSEEFAVFSLHSLLEDASRNARLHVRPGTWLGPSSVSHLLANAVNTNTQYNLYACLIAGEGGGAPSLSRVQLLEHSAQACALQTEASDPATPVLVLIPLVLGVDVLNEAYIPQLREVLSWKQTVGFVGGTKSSSIYAIGTEEKERVVFIDPHDVGEAAVSHLDAPSFFFSDARVLHWSELDPSVCLGFLCVNSKDINELCNCFLRLQQAFPHAPMVYVQEEEVKASMPWAVGRSADPQITTGIDHVREDDDWELL